MYIGIVIALLVIFDAIFLYIYRKRERNKWIENDLLKLQLEHERSMHQKINDVYEESRIIRHDLKHYLSVVLGLLINEEYDEARELIIKIIGRGAGTKVVRYQGSNVINAVLNDKQNMCDNMGIDLMIAISGGIPESKELNIAIILANLLENGIEAQSRVQNKKIWLNIMEQKGMLYIVVKNTIAEPVLENNPELKTTKADKTRHGFGISSVKELVKTMDGSFQQNEENGTFMSYISLPFDN